MNIRRLGLILLPLGLLFGACADDDDALDAEDVAALEQLMETFQAAMESGDIDAIMALYADGAVELPPNAPAIEGLLAIRNGYELQRGAEIDFEATPTVTEGSDDVAYQRGTFSSRVVLPGETEAITDQGKYLWVAKQQDDDSWRLVALMWNSSQP